MQIGAGIAALAARSARRWPLARGLTIAASVLALASCNVLQYRHGPSPILQGSEVAAASANKLVLLRALAQDASIGGDRASDWYLISEAGFNFVDDQCRAYFDELFFLDRRSERLKTGFVVADKTTAAILAVTGASVPTMNIVAQAFGFAINATDLIAGTYLYRLPPATTQGFVSKLQLRFRQEAAMARASVNSPTIAYYMIQRYLDLCLPPRIESEIAKQVNATTAVGVPGGPGAEALFSLETVSSPPIAVITPPVIPPAVRERVIVRGGDPLTKRKPLGEEPKQRIQDAFLLQVQASLCVPATGTLDSATDRAIRNYYSGFFSDEKAPAKLDLKNDPLLIKRLETATGNVADCKTVGFLNAYEVGAYGPREGVNQRMLIESLQRKIAILLQNRGLKETISVTGTLDTQTRDAIRALRGTRSDIDRSFDQELLKARPKPLATKNGATTAPAQADPAQPAQPGAAPAVAPTAPAKK